MKLEVGKKYVCRNRPNIKYIEIVMKDERLGDKPFIGLAVGIKGALYLFLENGMYGTSNIENDWDLISEYVKLVEFVKYFNIYRGFVSSGYRNVKEANNSADSARVGCKRVVFRGGEYDDVIIE